MFAEAFFTIFPSTEETNPIVSRFAEFLHKELKVRVIETVVAEMFVIVR